MDPTGKIGRTVSWLNKNIGLAEQISYSDVVQPLSRLDIAAAMKILKDVEQQAACISRPTAYILTAAHGQPGAAGGAVAFAPAVPMGRAVGAVGLGVHRLPPPAVAWPPPAIAPAKRTWKEEAKSPLDDQGKQISGLVGRLNNSVPLVEKLSYSDIKEPLEACGLEAALKILKDVEQSPHSIKNPTSYVIAAARRAVSGEAVPAKRPRTA